MVVFRRPSFLAAVAAAFTFLLLASISVVASFNYLGSDNETMWQRESGSGLAFRFTARKLLMGSSPPTCRSKCGGCGPCRAVHVPIQPGFVIPLEYYPEAWRCKCGNKLYMP